MQRKKKAKSAKKASHVEIRNAASADVEWKKLESGSRTVSEPELQRLKKNTRHPSIHLTYKFYEIKKIIHLVCGVKKKNMPRNVPARSFPDAASYVHSPCATQLPPPRPYPVASSRQYSPPSIFPVCSPICELPLAATKTIRKIHSKKFERNQSINRPTQCITTHWINQSIDPRIQRWTSLDRQ